MRLAANQVSSTAMYFPVARQRCRALSHGSYSMISMDVIASGSYITNYFGSSSKRSSTFWSLMFTPVSDLSDNLTPWSSGQPTPSTTCWVRVQFRMYNTMRSDAERLSKREQDVSLLKTG